VPVTFPSMRPLRLALNLVNISIPIPVAADTLHAALLDSAAPRQAAARILLEESAPTLLADLVDGGFIAWPELAAAAERYPPASHETAAWIRDMARLALARPVPAGA